MSHLVGAGLILGLAAAGYVGWLSQQHPEERYTSVCQLIKRDVVELGADGTPDQVDLELEWDPCPGDQYQVVRGGKDFAACTAKYQTGDYVPVKVVHFWDGLGFYRWDIEQLGDCTRVIDPGSPGSYEKSQECGEYSLFGREQGFECSRRPFRTLLKVCPFMARQ